MSKPRIYCTMLGAAGDEVTGSDNLLRIEYNDKVKFGCVDDGIFQGKCEERNFENRVDASKLDFVILTHCHADHFLALPFLRGFNGKIYATKSAITQGKELLYDAAINYEKKALSSFGIEYDEYKSMRTEFERLSKKNNAEELERYQLLKEALEEIKAMAPYTVEDVDELVKHFCVVYPYQSFIISDGIYARLFPSTHQNGACSVEIYVGDYKDDSVNISFSGDIGPGDSFLYRNQKYKPNPYINYCIMESLHGMEEKIQTPEDAYIELKNIIFDAVKKKKTVIIAGFALDRSAMLVYAINRMIDEYGLSVPVYLDSPLAHRELEHYQSDYHRKDNCWFKKLGVNPFDTSEIIVTDKYFEHVNVVRNDEPKVIITASAFGEGGRILDYFDHYIQNNKAVFVFAGWISPDCTSSVLHDAEIGKIVEIHGQHYVKYCKTHRLSGFTSHGYYSEFIEYIERFPCLKGLLMNHAEREAKIPLYKALKDKYDFEIHMPEMFDEGERSFYEITAECIREIKPIVGLEKFGDVLK